MNVLQIRRLPDIPGARWFRFSGCSVLFFFSVLTAGFGKHIYGGELSLQATARTNYYTLTLTLYLDQANATPDSYERDIDLHIFRKSDHVRVGTVNVRQAGSQQVRYDNQACASLRNLSVLAMNYSTEIYLNPTTYSDPGGYYVVWERCCRNDAISNIQNPGGEGMVFYMEFPAVVRNGTSFLNSTPKFNFPNGEYICIGKPFQLPFAATDADGDQLRYSLVTPLAGYTDNTGQNTVGSGRSYATYPDVIWLPGFSATSAIPGNPALSIDAQTGLLSVTANQTGLFIFAVLCEEYRNGVRIGAVRREFQMPVVDCGRNTPPPPIISYNAVETLDLAFCEGASVTLSTESDPQWSYQWQRNGSNIPGATAATLTVTEPGDYAVVKSFATVCGNDTISKITKAREMPLPTVAITPDRELPLCEGQSVVLSIQPETGVSYQWTANGTALKGVNGNSLTVTETGTYGVLATSEQECTNRDSLAVVVNPNPEATLTSSATAICQDGAVRLDATVGTGYRYDWSFNQSRLDSGTTASREVAQAGTYQVRITDGNGCQGLSNAITLTIIPRPVMQFDSLAPVCVSQATGIPLAASPAGGTFAGPGVNGNLFDPSKAGVGLHTITYTYTSAGICPVTVSRQIRVESPADIQMPERVSVLLGNSITLKPTLQGQAMTYQWTPPDYLSDPAVANPVSTPPVSTTYKLTVSSAGGCQAEKSILVDVLKQMFMADVFTPNDDGINDSWEIRNTEQFPDCEVTIYNRWGEVIFYSKGYESPWNGTYRNQKVQAGNYQYRIKTNQPLLPEYRGSLLVTY
ncbi:gliding motility-associated C-terminal domain-containing protein [Larkinella sp. VNQ87]|uniref:gliding motility-associated C-terminal domain-containing protein n=1 Tax=Larkinella sp. VNQ87 TaxID=3400921 RepID=UPI003C0A57C6